MVIDDKDSRVADYVAMVVLLLMAIGTVFVFSASANIGQELDLRRFYDFPGLRQMLFFPLACLVMLVASCFDYRRFNFARGWFRSPTGYWLILSIALLILVLLGGGLESRLARLW